MDLSSLRDSVKDAIGDSVSDSVQDAIDGLSPADVMDALSSDAAQDVLSNEDVQKALASPELADALNSDQASGIGAALGAGPASPTLLPEVDTDTPDTDAVYVDSDLWYNEGHEELEEEEKELLLTWAVLLMLSVLIMAFGAAYVLKRTNFHYLHEAGAALLLGVLVGLVVAKLDYQEEFKRDVVFHENIFFLVLLPPIIFESGYNMQHVRAFFQNFPAICALAFYGTAVSALVIGTAVYTAGGAGICYPFTYLQALIFGSLISATDPVTVLAIFSELGVNVNLYSLVFGESVLNDAVAIVLYRTLSTFVTEPVTGASILTAVTTFVVIFVGSTTIGSLVALSTSVFFKYTRFDEDHELQHMETCLVVLVPYVAYALAEAFELSGIVSILFCGIVMAHYTRPNLSLPSQEDTCSIFRTLAKLAETFVFIYMGVAMFLDAQDWRSLDFLLVSLAAMLAARAVNVYPATWIINQYRPPSRRIPPRHQLMLWISGLRGAIAFALALNSARVLGEGPGKQILTCTLLLVAITVIFIGGATTSLVDHFHLRQDPQELKDEAKLLEMGSLHPGESCMEEEGGEEGAAGGEGGEADVLEGAPSSPSAGRRRWSMIKEDLKDIREKKSFTELDNRILKPMFHKAGAASPKASPVPDAPPDRA